MDLFGALLVCAFIITVKTNHIPQKTRPNYDMYKIPHAASDGRPACHLVTSLNDMPKECSEVLPYKETSYFNSRGVLLCFGVYDTHYELCKYNKTTLVVPNYEAKQFCDKAKTVLEKYEPNHKNSLIEDLGPRLKTALSDQENCTSLCIFREELNPLCTRIVAAVELYPDTPKKSNSSKASEQPPVPQKSIKTIDTLGNVELKTVSPEEDVAHVAANPAVGNQVAGNVVESSHDEVIPVSHGVPSSLVVESKGAAGSVPVNPVEVSQTAAKPQETLPKLEGELSLSPSINVPKDVEAAAPKPDAVEKMAELPATPPPYPIDNEGPDQQSQDPDPEETKDEDPGEIDKLSDGDKDIGDVNKMEEAQRPLMMGRLEDDEESNLVTYFILMTGGALLFYVAFHNKNKLLALALEGRRANRRGGRHSSAAYSKLHSNLEEAIAAGPNSPSATHVLY